jgi:hypothetical protein
MHQPNWEEFYRIICPPTLDSTQGFLGRVLQPVRDHLAAMLVRARSVDFALTVFYTYGDAK